MALRGINIKKSGARPSLCTRALGRDRLPHNSGVAAGSSPSSGRHPRPGRQRDPAGLLQVRLHRRGEVLVDAKVVSDAVDLVQELLARLVVIDLLALATVW